MRKQLLLIPLILLILNLSNASEKVVISKWLTVEPFAGQLPAFHTTHDVNNNPWGYKELLTSNELSLKNYFPIIGQPLSENTTGSRIWVTNYTDGNGYYVFNPGADTTSAQTAYLAVYIKSKRFLSTSLEIRSAHMLQAWINGEPIGKKTTVETDEGTVGSVTKDLELELGTHLLIIKTLRTPDAKLEWQLSANLEIKEPYMISDIDISTVPEYIKTIDHILDGVKISGLSLSPDGKYYAVNYSLVGEDKKTERWTEIKRSDDQRLVHSFRYARISQLKWLPRTNRISYISQSDDKSSMYVHDIDKGTIIPVFENLRDFSGYNWSPVEDFVIYGVIEKGNSTDTDMRQVIGMQDRQSLFRNRTQLYRCTFPAGIHQRITHGKLTSSLEDISPDGKKILVSQTYPDYTTRPFTRQNMYLINLSTFSVDTLWSDITWGLSVSFSPDGKQLLATGGPSAFAGAGENVPEGTLPNNFDTQAYIYDLASRQVNPITKTFNPSISSATWHEPSNMIYLLTTDEDYARLYQYDPEKGNISLVDFPADFITNASFASQAGWGAISASNTNEPSRHYLMNLRNGKTEVIEDTESEIYRHVIFGDVKNWDFNTAEGLNIKGRVYYPPDFDPENKYPAIVYYYGGTTPVGRTFGGRYPFNLWAGNGYIVYVLQPSGATGFGQQFSAAHVNNWGITVADEIIEGTKKFLEAHPFVDAKKVGCAGASYGGFMTMLLMTRTNIYAAAISHAGISSISSYWGEGLWGYSYSSEASAESYPWNSPEMYVEQSPLFNADKINTPLLLLTGDSDTNVPPGESIQLYTALKILDRPVELIMVKDQDHHILDYGKRKLWHQTIMAWWDRYLKDQPEWWNKQYPPSSF